MDYRFVSDRAGRIRCTVAKDIWSASNNTKLIEKGTTATGIYQTGITQGQGRAFIMMTKLRTRQRPYLDIPLIDTNAAGELGESGVDGWIDTHFWERFGGALMVGMIPDIGAWASNNAGKKTAIQTIQRTAARLWRIWLEPRWKTALIFHQRFTRIREK